jgi:hypothetical protein
VTQPGQPYQPTQQPSWQPWAPPAQGYPEPTGNYTAFQQNPPGAPAQQTPAGLLRVQLQGNKVTSSWLTPTLLINNQMMQVAYGTNDYVLPAGPYRVTVIRPLALKNGQTSLDVAVYPGQTVEMYYAVPWIRFESGSMGFVKQSRKGFPLFVFLMVVEVAALSFSLVALFHVIAR